MKGFLSFLMSLVLFPLSPAYATRGLTQVEIDALMEYVKQRVAFAGEDSGYNCEPVSGVDARDYQFDVIPVKKGDQKEIGPKQSLDLSVYRGKIVLLSIFSPSCGWCMTDLSHHSHFQYNFWPSDRVVMVNLSYGPLVNEKPVEERLEATPQEVLDFVKEDYKKQTRYGRDIDLENVDFYHVVDTQTGTVPLDSIRKLKSQDAQTLLFPGLRGTPYSVIIDEAGGIHFRGHLKGGVEIAFDRHYGFITSLVNQSCEVPPPLQARKPASETGEEVPLTKKGLYIGQSAYYKGDTKWVTRNRYLGDMGHCLVHYGDRVRILFTDEDDHSVLAVVMHREEHSSSPDCNRTEFSHIPKEDLVPEDLVPEDDTHQVDDFRKGRIVYHDAHYILVPAAASNNSDVDNSKQFCNIRYGEKLRIEGFSGNTHFALARILPTGPLEDGRFYRDRINEKGSWYKKISFDNSYGACERDQKVFVLKDKLTEKPPLAEYVFDRDIDSVFSVFTIHKNDELYISHTIRDFIEVPAIHGGVCRSRVGSKVRTIAFAEDGRAILVELLEEKGGDEALHRIVPVCNKGDRLIVTITSLAGPAWLALDKWTRFLRETF